MNATNIINLYCTWYKGLEITVEDEFITGMPLLKICDTKTGCTYRIFDCDMIMRTFKTIGVTRLAVLGAAN